MPAAHAQHLARALLALGAAWLALPAWADDPPPAAAGGVRGWLERRDLPTDLGYLRDHALQIAGQQGCPNDLAAELREALAPDTVFQDVVERLEDAGGSARLPPVEAFAATPLGLRMATADAARPRLDGDGAWRTGAIRLRRAPPDAKRAARIERVARASRDADLWADAESRLRRILRDACIPAETGGRTQQEDAMLDAIDAAQGSQRRMHFITTLSVVLYEGYETLADADLDAYAAFLESPQTGGWLEARNAAIVAALEAAARQLVPPAPIPL